MKIELYVVYNRKTDVKKNLTTKVMDVEGTLKFPTNYLDPIIRIQDDRIGREMPYYNYAYVREFRRFYFIQNMVFISSSLIDLYMHVDVLHTYIGAENGYIRNETALINRNEFDYNEKIEDTRYHYEAIPSVTYTPLQSNETTPTGVPIKFKDPIGENDCNVLVTIMTSRDAGSETFLYPNTKNTKLVRSNYSASNLGTVTFCLTWEQAQDFAKQCFYKEDLRTLVQSMVVLPFKIHSAYMNLDRQDGKLMIIPQSPIPEQQFVQLSNTVPQDVYVLDTIASLNFYIFYADNIRDYINFEETFFDSEKYTLYDLYIPFVGWRTLDRSLFKTDGSVRINYLLDPLTANSKVQVTMNGDIIMTEDASLGVKVNLSSTNLWENQQRENAITANQTTSVIIGGLTAIVGTVMSFIPGGQLMGIGMVSAGIGGAVASGVKGEAEKSLLFHKGNQGSYGACDALFLYEYPVLRVTKNIITESYLDSAYLEENGAPLYDTRQISDLLGYTEFGKIDFKMENVQEEKELVELLQSGVHFPTTSGW